MIKEKTAIDIIIDKVIEESYLKFDREELKLLKNNLKYLMSGLIERSHDRRISLYSEAIEQIFKKHDSYCVADFEINLCKTINKLYHLFIFRYFKHRNIKYSLLDAKKLIEYSDKQYCSDPFYGEMMDKELLIYEDILRRFRHALYDSKVEQNISIIDCIRNFFSNSYNSSIQ